MSQNITNTAPNSFSPEYAKFYNGNIQTVPAHVQVALEQSPLPAGALPTFARVRAMQEHGHADVETGYTMESDGSAHVAVLTPMPGVTPQMWDWWFAWHGCSAQRYKLWHPLSHIDAHWEDGRDDIAYVGRTSIIEEFIGTEKTRGAVRFTSPVEFGFSPEAVKNTPEAVYICARVGHASLPVDYGYLLHQVRAVEGGSEMRSRFWLGGAYIHVRKEGIIADVVSGFAQKMQSVSEQFAKDLLLHCAEEMNHLASFLPTLYADMNQSDMNQKNDTTLHVQGRVIERTNKDFDSIAMGTLFNKIHPGRMPDAIVEPTSVQDIIATIKYAQARKKKVTVCSGGHSWSANHLRNDSILIKMSKFDSYEINAKEMTARAGPAVGGSTLLSALYKQKLFFPAGHCKGVCIGGYLLQGGYGWNGRKIGMACENVIGMDIVTADGEFVHASETENADLFWAARGSGAGFFGVVVSFTLKLSVLPPYRGTILHNFSIKHLEDVYRWAYEVGSTVPNAVEFQMILSKNMMNFLGPGIEAIAPIFADTKDEYHEAMQFMKNSPIKKKALLRTPPLDPGINFMYKTAMSHYPENRYWGVDNMWTHAGIDDLIPYMKEIAETLPPPPSHVLWLNWHPNTARQDMVYSNEDNIYIALYSTWKSATETAKYGDWATNMMKKMSHLATGIQLADEGLHKRAAPFLSNENMKKLQAIRAERDPKGMFHEWHSKPEVS